MVKVSGDGDCLFHALGRADNHDGGALRIEVADFMDHHAHAQPGFQEVWLREAAKLRCNRWGGHTVITAYSLMKNTRVMLHTKKADEEDAVVEEVSHGAVHGHHRARLVHILYNGANHYDALEVLADLEGMEPAWPQPRPPTYFVKADEGGSQRFPSLQESARLAKTAKRRSLTAPKPAKKAKAKSKAKAKASGPKPRSKPAPEFAEGTLGHAPEQPEEAEGAEGPDEAPTVPGFSEELESIPVAAESQHPHRKVEDLIQDRVVVFEGSAPYLPAYTRDNARMHTHIQISAIAAPVQELATTLLREHPTIPPRAALDDVDAGANWPAAFCAFTGCMWEEQNGTEGELEHHLRKEHGEELLPICEHMLRGSAPDAMKSVYNQAIAVKCRQQPPLAGASLDRTALRTFTDATKGAKVEALICFCCGGIRPYVEEVKDQGSIKWHQPVQRSDSTGELLFLDHPMEEVEHLLGLQVYLERYNTDSQRPNTKLTDHESFADWQLKLPGLEDGALICCPEACFTESWFLIEI